MKVTRQQMKDARVPLQFRDYCAHLLIPLNQCRSQTWFSPWKCNQLRHSYEECQYIECAAARNTLAATTESRPRRRPARCRYVRRAAILEQQKRAGPAEE